MKSDLSAWCWILSPADRASYAAVINSLEREKAKIERAILALRIHLRMEQETP